MLVPLCYFRIFDNFVCFFFSLLSFFSNGALSLLSFFWSEDSRARVTMF